MCGGLPHISSEIVTYTAVASVNGKPVLEIAEISLDRNEEEEAKKCMKTNGCYVHFNMPVGTTE